MEVEFPLEANPSQLLGMIELIKENNGTDYLSILAEDSNEQIDDLLPLIDAITLLGFAKTKKGIVTLTKKGKELTPKNFYHILPPILVKIEPFKTAISAILKNKVTTSAIAKYLKGKKIVLHKDPETNEALLRNLLLTWGSRTKIINYISEEDSWEYTYKTSKS